MSISDSLETKTETISRWLGNFESIERFTGCSVGTDLLLQENWLAEDFSRPLNNIEQQLISQNTGNSIYQRLLIYFKNNIHGRDNFFLFDNEMAVRDCLETLLELGFKKKNLSIMVSKGHPLYQEKPYFFSLEDFTEYTIKPYQAFVNARSRSANVQPGIGVKIGGKCPRNKRFPLRYELHILLTAAWCEIGVDSEIWAA